LSNIVLIWICYSANHSSVANNELYIFEPSYSEWTKLDKNLVSGMPPDGGEAGLAAIENTLFVLKDGGIGAGDTEGETFLFLPISFVRNRFLARGKIPTLSSHFFLYQMHGTACICSTHLCCGGAKPCLGISKIHCLAGSWQL
jgi:hypothetical protein